MFPVQIPGAMEYAISSDDIFWTQTPPGKTYVPVCVLLYSQWSYHMYHLSQVFTGTVKPVLRDHCHERLPVLTDHTFLVEGSNFSIIEDQRPPVLTDHIFVASGVVFQDRFYCNKIMLSLNKANPTTSESTGFYGF